MIRPTPAGRVATPLYVAGGLAWLAQLEAQLPKAALGVYLGLVAIAGLFLPGAANQVSLARAYLALPGLVYALASRWYGALALCVALAGLTDLLDGALARRRGGATPLGGALDPLVDGLFFGAVAAGLAIGGAYPGWLAGVVTARYAVPAAFGGALLAAGRRPQLRHTFFGQLSTVLIAVLLGGVALLHWLAPGAPELRLRGVGEVLIPIAALATFANLLWSNRAAVFIREEKEAISR